MSTIEMIETPADTSALAIRENIQRVETALSEFDKISAGLAELRQRHPVDLAIDVTTTKGMREAVAARAAWRDPRIAVEKARKAAKAPVLALGKDIDARAAYITTALLEGESNYDDQIKAEETRKEAEKAAEAEAERVRVAAHHERIAEIRGAIGAASNCSAELILDHIGDIERLHVDDGFEEFQGQAQLAKDETLDKLRAMHGAAVAAEAEAARIKAEQEAEAARIAAEREELDRLRAEQAKRDAEAAEARAAAEREQAERLAAERAEQEAELKRQREAQEAELRAQREAQAAVEAAQREERAKEERRIAAERADLDRRQREAEEAQRKEIALRSAAEAKVREAAPQMLDALLQWQRAEESGDADELKNARVSRDIAIAAAQA